MRVAVYRNLTKKCLSVKALEGPLRGRVIAYSREICLEDVEFRVSEKGRQRVINEKRKNVHAYVIGKITNSLFDKLSTRLMYNPYKTSSFVSATTGVPVRTADRVRITTEGAFV